jgi:hypothetical protein
MGKSRQQNRVVAAKSLETPDQSPTKSLSPSKAKFTPKFDSKKKGFNSATDIHALSRNGAPQILIKKSSTKEKSQDEDEN